MDHSANCIGNNLVQPLATGPRGAKQVIQVDGNRRRRLALALSTYYYIVMSHNERSVK